MYANYFEKIILCWGFSKKNGGISHLRSTWNGWSWSNWLSHQIVVISRRSSCYIGVWSPGPGVSTPAGHHSLFRLREDRNSSCWHRASSTVSAKYKRCNCKSKIHKVLMDGTPKFTFHENTYQGKWLAFGGNALIASITRTHCTQLLHWNSDSAVSCTHTVYCLLFLQLSP